MFHLIVSSHLSTTLKRTKHLKKKGSKGKKVKANSLGV